VEKVSLINHNTTIEYKELVIENKVEKKKEEKVKKQPPICNHKKTKTAGGDYNIVKRARR